MGCQVWQIAVSSLGLAWLQVTSRGVLTNIARILHVHCDQRRIVSCCGGAKIVIWDFTMQGDSTEGRRVDAPFF